MSAALWRSPDDTRSSGVSRVGRRARADSSSVSATARKVAPEARFLAELVAAQNDVRLSIEAAFSGMARGPDLAALRGELRGRLDQLLDALSTSSDEQDALDALVPFVFFVDEQVEHVLAARIAPGGSSWSQLQRDLFPERRAEGGDVFYERASKLLDEAPPRPPVVAAYLFCLKAGFRGRLAEEPDEVTDGWIRDLAARLPSTARRRGGRAPAWRAPRRTATYFLAAAVAIVAWHIVVATWAYLLGTAR
jgi:type VI protein secretion system component VasF